MNTLIKTTDIRIAYKVAIWLLLSNNIVGIALNPAEFALSIIFLAGIPGAGFTLHYFISAFRKEPTMVALVHICAILYNILIWTMLKGIENIVIGDAIWPTINITLSSLAFIFCSINFFLNPEK